MVLRKVGDERKDKAKGVCQASACGTAHHVRAEVWVPSHKWIMDQSPVEIWLVIVPSVSFGFLWLPFLWVSFGFPLQGCHSLASFGLSSSALPRKLPPQKICPGCPIVWQPLVSFAFQYIYITLSQIGQHPVLFFQDTQKPGGGRGGGKEVQGNLRPFCGGVHSDTPMTFNSFAISKTATHPNFSRQALLEPLVKARGRCYHHMSF